MNVIETNQYKKVKEQYPEALILLMDKDAIAKGDGAIRAYGEDAVTVAKMMNWVHCEDTMRDKGTILALDTTVRQLVASGKTVVIMRKKEIDTKVFNIEIKYFKENGKFYSDSTFPCEAGICGEPPSCYMNDVVDYIKNIKHSSGKEKLPGLSTCHWTGYIVVDCEEGFPVLILPEK